MSGYKNFAVAGAGTIGKIIVEELLRKKDAGEISSVTVLSRSSDSHADLADKGADIIAVDYSLSSSLEHALQFSHTDVLISTLGLAGIGLQDALATSAKAAGVKLFVPSDFGTEPHGQTENIIFSAKVAIMQRLKELELPYAVFYTGLFSDTVFFPGYATALGLNFSTNEFSIPGSGNMPISWTTTKDVARFVAHVLTALPRDKIEWRIFRIEGDRMSFNDVASVWEKHTGKLTTISHRARSGFEDAVKKNPMDFMALFILEIDARGFVVGDTNDLANAEFPQWKPKKVIDSLVEIYGQ